MDETIQKKIACVESLLLDPQRLRTQVPTRQVRSRMTMGMPPYWHLADLFVTSKTNGLQETLDLGGQNWNNCALRPAASTEASATETPFFVLTNTALAETGTFNKPTLTKVPEAASTVSGKQLLRQEPGVLAQKDRSQPIETAQPANSKCKCSMTKDLHKPEDHRKQTFEWERHC